MCVVNLVAEGAVVVVCGSWQRSGLVEGCHCVVMFCQGEVSVFSAVFLLHNVGVNVLSMAFDGGRL